MELTAQQYEKIQQYLIEIQTAIEEKKEYKDVMGLLILEYRPLLGCLIGRRKQRLSNNLGFSFSEEDAYQEVVLQISGKFLFFYEKAEDPTDPVAFSKWVNRVCSNKVISIIRGIIRTNLDIPRVNTKDEVKALWPCVLLILSELEVDLVPEEEVTLKNDVLEHYRALFVKTPVVIDPNGFAQHLDDMLLKRLRTIVVEKKKVDDINKADSMIEQSLQLGYLDDFKEKTVMNRVGTQRLVFDDCDAGSSAQIELGYNEVGIDTQSGRVFFSSGDRREAQYEVADTLLRRCLSSVLENKRLAVDRVLVWLSYCYTHLEMNWQKGITNKEIKAKTGEYLKEKNFYGLLDDLAQQSIKQEILGLSENQLKHLKERLANHAIRRKKPKNLEPCVHISGDGIAEEMIEALEKINRANRIFAQCDEGAKASAVDNEKCLQVLLSFPRLPCWTILESGDEEIKAVEFARNPDEVIAREIEWLDLIKPISEEIEEKEKQLKELIEAIDEWEITLTRAFEEKTDEQWLLFPKMTLKALGEYTVSERMDKKMTNWLHCINTSLKIRRDSINGNE